MKQPNAAKMMEKMPAEVGMGSSGSVAAMATMRHAETEGAAKAHLSSMRMTQGYAVMNRLKIAGARKIATKVPRPWTSHCWIGGVRSRKPVRKSCVRSVAWLAPMFANAPPSKLSR